MLRGDGGMVTWIVAAESVINKLGDFSALNEPDVQITQAEVHGFC